MRRRIFLTLVPAAALHSQTAAPAKPAAPAAAPAEDVILRAMTEEMARCKSLNIVSVERPYYIEYALHDGENLSAAACLGALVSYRRARYRLPRIQVRVGDQKFDNTNYIGTDFFSGARYDVDEFPLDDSSAVLRHHLWLATDAAYKGAVEAISRKRAALKNVSVTEELPDFGPVEPVQFVGELRRQVWNDEAWKARVRKLSAVFQDFPAVAASGVDAELGSSVFYLVTSEGTRVRSPEGSTGVRVRAAAYAPDGMLLRDAAVYHAPSAEALPNDTELERGVRQVGQNLTALAAAPVGESYTGPVLFEGVAGAQILAELLGKNLTLPRRPVSNPGRPLAFAAGEFEGRIGSRILPEWLDVVDDPTQTEFQGRKLFGHYEVDLEGVRPQPLTLVEKGVLKNLLLTRQPVKGSGGTNGRARLPGAFGHKAAGFGNLFVRAAETTPASDLKKKLIEMITARSKPYGILVRKMDFPSSAAFDEVRRLITGAADSGGRPVSLPLLVYRVYPDGREELVRGLRFRRLTTRSLKDILAAGDQMHVFDFLDNNAPFAVMGGASFVSETSIVAPAILVDDLELDKLPQDYPRPPLVPAPPLAPSRT